MFPNHPILVKYLRYRAARLDVDHGLDLRHIRAARPTPPLAEWLIKAATYKPVICQDRNGENGSGPPQDRLLRLIAKQQ